MFSLTIAFGPTNALWAFMFKSEEKAAEVVTLLNGANPQHVSLISFVDDFGQSGSFVAKNINAFLLEDLEQSKLAHVERALHQARTQARAQKLASSDSEIRMAAQGPSVISPMNGGFPRHQA